VGFNTSFFRTEGVTSKLSACSSPLQLLNSAVIAQIASDDVLDAAFAKF
jgi:hypothetical protein